VHTGTTYVIMLEMGFIPMRRGRRRSASIWRVITEHTAEVAAGSEQVLGSWERSPALAEGSSRFSPWIL